MVTSDGCDDRYQDTFRVRRHKIFICDAGLKAIYGTINTRGGTADPYFHVDADKVCQNGLTAFITAHLVYTKPQQCERVGNPCDPITGAQLEHVADWQEGELAIRRNYNSLRTASAFDHFGPGWHFPHAEKLIKSTTWTDYMVRITNEGHVERYDWDAARNAYLSATQRDAQLRVDGTGWELLLPSGERRRFDQHYRLISVENRNRPASRVDIHHATADLPDAPKGAIIAITDAEGRELQLHYAIINPVTTAPGGTVLDPCAGQASPACRGWRVASVSLNGSPVATYGYDLAGNLSQIAYAGGTGMQYHYNEPANICPAGSNACSAGTPPAGGFPHHLTGVSNGQLNTLQR